MNIINAIAEIYIDLFVEQTPQLILTCHRSSAPKNALLNNIWKVEYFSLNKFHLKCKNKYTKPSSHPNLLWLSIKNWIICLIWSIPTGVNESTILNGGLFEVECKCFDFFGKANNFFDLSLTLVTFSLLWQMEIWRNKTNISHVVNS